MDAENERKEKAGEATKREMMKWYGVMILSWLYIVSLASLIVGALVIAFTNHTSVWPFVIALAIIASGAWVISGMMSSQTKDRVKKIGVVFACVLFFMGAWWIPLGPNELAVKESGEQITLYQGGGVYFNIPYTGKISYLRNSTVEAKASLALDDEGEVIWEAKANLKLVADYNQSFFLLRRFRGTTPWKEAVQQLFQEQVNDYIAQNVDPNQSVIPKNMRFKLTPEQQEGFSGLGFSAEEITLREISRFIYRKPKGES